MCKTYVKKYFKYCQRIQKQAIFPQMERQTMFLDRKINFVRMSIFPKLMC